jgi:peptide/nickel transport system permease protein
MLNYVLRRLLLMIPMLFGVSLVTFVVSRTLPADPVVAAVGLQAADHPLIVAAYRQKWGLDKPLPVQYLVYLNNLVHGNLGISIYTHRPVLSDLRDYVPATVELATASLLISLVIAIPFGIYAATHRGSIADLVIRLVTLLGTSMPIFWLALLAFDVLYVNLGLLPGTGRLSTGVPVPPTVTGMYTVDSLLAGQLSAFVDALWHLLLPAFVLASWSLGLLTRITRSSMLSVLHQDYLRSARSRGAPELYVILRHALKNAAVPVITVIGLAYGDLLSGAVVTETIFSWPGIGRYTFQAASHADFPAIIGVSLLVALIYIVVNLIVDVVYSAVDPRVQLA